MDVKEQQVIPMDQQEVIHKEKSLKSGYLHRSWDYDVFMRKKYLTNADQTLNIDCSPLSQHSTKIRKRSGLFVQDRSNFEKQQQKGICDGKIFKIVTTPHTTL